MQTLRWFRWCWLSVCCIECFQASSPFDATLVKVDPTPNNGYSELVPLYKKKDTSASSVDIWFVFQKMRYIYDAEEKKRFEAVQFPVHWTVGEYMEWKGYMDDEAVKASINSYGKNRHVS
ncbi:Manganese-transporting ATPase 13A1 [Lamellibrachia satsuma]|nr:Manganese-transporting ATPase 13A1 [Lamellibrachia satsuma]